MCTLCTAEDKPKELVNLVDPKRAYNVDITLARFRYERAVCTALTACATLMLAADPACTCAYSMTHGHIRDVILSMDEQVLNVDMCQQLLNIAPTPEEVESVTAFAQDADASLLGNTEQFFLAVSAVPRIQRRCVCVL